MPFFLPLFATMIATAHAAVDAAKFRDDLVAGDRLVRRSQQVTLAGPKSAAKAAVPSAKDEVVYDFFRDGGDRLTRVACEAKEGGALDCDFSDYSLHALTDANVESLSLLGGETLKGFFALKKATDATLATDFEVFCHVFALPRLLPLPDGAPFANQGFDANFKKALEGRCKTPDLKAAKAFLAEAGPLVQRTCQLESEGGRRQILRADGDRKWRGAPGECDAVRYELVYDAAKKSGSLTRTPVPISGGDKCEDVFGDPLAGDEAAEAGGDKARSAATLVTGTFDLGACDTVRWSESFPFLTINLVEATKKPAEPDPRYEQGVLALFEGETAEASKQLSTLTDADPKNGMARLALGVALEREQKLDLAAKEFEAASGLLKGKKIGHSADGRVVAFVHYGAMRFESGKASEALPQFDKAIAIEPTSFNAHFWKAAALAELKRDKEAAQSFTRALALRQSFERVTEFVFGEFGDTESMLADFVTPAPDVMLNAAAWRLATSKDEGVRDPTKAIDLAKQALDMADQRSGRYLDTLASAYAAAGKFPEAVDYETRAIEELGAEGAEAEEKKAMEGRLALYKAGKSYQE